MDGNSHTDDDTILSAANRQLHASRSALGLSAAGTLPTLPRFSAPLQVRTPGANPLAAIYPHLGRPGVCARCGAAAPSSSSAWVNLCGPCTARAKREAEEAHRRQAEEDAREAERLRVQRLTAPLGEIPEAHRGLRFGSVELAGRVRRPEAAREAEAALGAAMVLLVGPAGAGKTSLAAASLVTAVDHALAGDRAAIKLVTRAHWTTAPDLARARREHRLGAGEAAEVERALRASFLVIDDLGQEVNDRDGALVELIYERHAHRRATVVTTGLNYKSIVERYNDGIARRLTEASQAILVRCAPTVVREAA